MKNFFWMCRMILKGSRPYVAYRFVKIMSNQFRKIRRFRILIYEGDELWVNETIRRSLSGVKDFGFGTIRVVDFGI